MVFMSMILRVFLNMLRDKTIMFVSVLVIFLLRVGERREKESKKGIRAFLNPLKMFQGGVFFLVSVSKRVCVREQY